MDYRDIKTALFKTYEKYDAVANTLRDVCISIGVRKFDFGERTELVFTTHETGRLGDFVASQGFEFHSENPEVRTFYSGELDDYETYTLTRDEAVGEIKKLFELRGVEFGNELI